MGQSNWWHKRPNESAGLIVANSFWQALATCAPEQLRLFLHADVGLCVDSFAAALCALALSDLPFSTTALGYAESQGDVAVTSVAPALLASAQLLTSELVAPAKKSYWCKIICKPTSAAFGAMVNRTSCMLRVI